MRINIYFDPEIAPISPAKIEIKFGAMIGDKRQPDEFVSRRFEIPATARVRDFIGKPAAARKFLVRDANDVEIEIVHRIAEAPFHAPMMIVGPVPRGRIWVVNVLEPPDRVQLVVEVNRRRLLPRFDRDRVPMDVRHRVGVGCRGSFRCGFRKDIAGGEQEESSRQKQRQRQF